MWSQTPTLQELDPKAYEELQTLYGPDELEFVRRVLAKLEGLDGNRVHYRLLAIYRRLSNIENFEMPDPDELDALNDFKPR